MRATNLLLLMAIFVVGPACAERKGEPAKSVPPHYDSPQAVFEASRQAIRRQDWRALYDCYTPESQADSMFELFFACSMHEEKPTVQAILTKHGLTEKALEAESQKRGKKPDHEASTGDEERELLVTIVNAIVVDKPGFFADASAYLEASETEEERNNIGPLQDVVITGDTATGQANVRSFTLSRDEGEQENKRAAHDELISFQFQKTAQGWLRE